MLKLHQHFGLTAAPISGRRATAMYKKRCTGPLYDTFKPTYQACAAGKDDILFNEDPHATLWDVT